MEGWIKIHRKVLDNPIVTKDSDTLAIWIYLLLNATHEEYDVLFKGKRITLQKGQLITGTISIAKKLKINKDKVQRTLKLFESDKQIAQQTSNQNRLISILKWEEYQKNDKQNDKQMINECETNDKRVITNKNVKNIKNDKNVKNVVEESKEETIDSCVDGLDEVIEFYNNNISLITPYAKDVFVDYLKEMPKDLIILAMKKATESNARNIKYIKAILNNWSSKGIKSIIDAKQEEYAFKNKNIKHEETVKEETERLRKEWGLTDED